MLLGAAKSSSNAHLSQCHHQQLESYIFQSPTVLTWDHMGPENQDLTKHMAFSSKVSCVQQKNLYQTAVLKIKYQVILHAIGITPRLSPGWKPSLPQRRIGGLHDIVSELQKMRILWYLQTPGFPLMVCEPCFYPTRKSSNSQIWT